MFLNIFEKKKHLITLLISTLLCNIASAEETEATYLRLDAGLTQSSEKLGNNDTYYKQNLDGAEFYGFGAGYIFNKNIRTDLTLTGRTNSKFSYEGEYFGNSVSANQNISSTTLMLNAYYSLPINNTFSPYINAGLGAARISMGDYSSSYNSGEATYSISSSTNYNFAWNLGLGGQMKLNKNLAFDAFFRFIDFGKTKTQYKSMSNDDTPDAVDSFSLRSYETGISLIYRF